MTNKLGRPVMLDYDRMVAFLEKRITKDQSELVELAKVPDDSAKIFEVLTEETICKTSISFCEMILMCAPSWIVDEKAKRELAIAEQKETEATDGEKE